MSHATDSESWGLAAYGRQGDVELELMESIADERWYMQLGIGLMRLGLAVAPGVLHDLRQFLAETFRTGVYLDPEVAPGTFRYMPEKSLVLGTAGDTLIKLEKDGKYDDRYFVDVDLRSGLLRVALTVEQAIDLIAAVEQAIADLAP